MLRLPRHLYEEMVAHAREEDPNECCGILAGKDGRVLRLYRIPNVERSPYRYLMDPREQYRAMKDAEKNGWDLLAFYHSHTRTEAYPSATDVRLAANWPEPLYLIISLQDKEKPVVRAFSIKWGAVREERLVVEEPGGVS